MASTVEIEEIRESIWQSHKQEENALIKEIEQSHAKLKQLQLQYTAFELRVSQEVTNAITQKNAKIEPQPLIKIKLKCSKCKSEGHNKKSCKL